jgi:hypothetical protein
MKHSVSGSFVAFLIGLLVGVPTGVLSGVILVAALRSGLIQIPS